jgi:aldose sugar dehydrogenase
MKSLIIAGLFLALAANQGDAQFNAGTQQPKASAPFTLTQITTLKLLWRIAFLPDGRMLITEKVGGLWLVTQQGAKTPVSNIPAVLFKGQGGMLGIFNLSAL